MNCPQSVEALHGSVTAGVRREVCYGMSQDGCDVLEVDSPLLGSYIEDASLRAEAYNDGLLDLSDTVSLVASNWHHKALSNSVYNAGKPA